MPVWLGKLLDTGEFLAFGLFFSLLTLLARRQRTDSGFTSWLQGCAVIQYGLFILFTILDFTMQSGFRSVYGSVYLLSLFFAFGVSIRMRRTIETVR